MRVRFALVVAVILLVMAGPVWAVFHSNTDVTPVGQQVTAETGVPGQGPAAAGGTAPNGAEDPSPLAMLGTVASNVVQLPCAYLVLGSTLLCCAGLLRKVTG